MNNAAQFAFSREYSLGKNKFFFFRSRIEIRIGKKKRKSPLQLPLFSVCDSPRSIVVVSFACIAFPKHKYFAWGKKGRKKKKQVEKRRRNEQAKRSLTAFQPKENLKQGRGGSATFSIPNESETLSRSEERKLSWILHQPSFFHLVNHGAMRVPVAFRTPVFAFAVFFAVRSASGNDAFWRQ